MSEAKESSTSSPTAFISFHRQNHFLWWNRREKSCCCWHQTALLKFHCNQSQRSWSELLQRTWQAFSLFKRTLFLAVLVPMRAVTNWTKATQLDVLCNLAAISRLFTHWRFPYFRFWSADGNWTLQDAVKYDSQFCMCLPKSLHYCCLNVSPVAKCIALASFYGYQKFNLWGNLSRARQRKLPRAFPSSVLFYSLQSTILMLVRVIQARQGK